MTSIWSPACQDTSHVGAAGIGLVSLKGDPVSIPSIATPEFRRYRHMGRALLCSYFWVYGFQEADKDLEKLALTELLFQAVCARPKFLEKESLFYFAGKFNVLPWILNQPVLQDRVGNPTHARLTGNPRVPAGNSW